MTAVWLWVALLGCSAPVSREATQPTPAPPAIAAVADPWADRWVVVTRVHDAPRGTPSGLRARVPDRRIAPAELDGSRYAGLPPCRHLHVAGGWTTEAEAEAVREVVAAVVPEARVVQTGSVRTLLPDCSAPAVSTGSLRIAVQTQPGRWLVDLEVDEATARYLAAGAGDPVPLERWGTWRALDLVGVGTVEVGQPFQLHALTDGATVNCVAMGVGVLQGCGGAGVVARLDCPDAPALNSAYGVVTPPGGGWRRWQGRGTVDDATARAHRAAFDKHVPTVRARQALERRAARPLHEDARVLRFEMSGSERFLVGVRWWAGDQDQACDGGLEQRVGLVQAPTHTPVGPLFDLTCRSVQALGSLDDGTPAMVTVEPDGTVVAWSGGTRLGAWTWPPCATVVP